MTGVSLPEPAWVLALSTASFGRPLRAVRARDRRADGEVVDSLADYFEMRSVSADDVAGDEYATPFEYEIETGKKLGFNMLRKHIKPTHPDFVEAADRLGILVWEEPANPTTYTDRSKREVREQFRGMVERDYISPSVVAWSLYNEEWGIGLDQADYSDHDWRLWNDAEKQAYLTDLYHEYYVSPDRHGAWEDGLDHLLANPGENYGVENTPAADAPVLISEFGTWGFPDLPGLRERDDGDPPWFGHDCLDGLKRPAGVDDRFEATDLPDVFGDYEALADAWQTRESVSLRGIIEAIRTHDEVPGYVVTEFSHIEWEFNGVLDYHRERKGFADEFARLNDDLLVSVVPERHVVAPGEELRVDVHVVNDTGAALSGELRWTGPGADGAREAEVEGFGTTAFEAVTTVAPPVDADTGAAAVTMTFDASDREVTGTEPVFVVAAEPASERTVYADDALAGALGERHPVVESVADADIAVVTEVTGPVAAFVEGGGSAVVVPGPDGQMADKRAFEYRNLPDGESWNLVASLCYQDAGCAGRHHVLI